MSRAIFIHSNQISNFADDVQSALVKGWDLYMGLVNGDGEIGQWAVEEKSFYEYHLVIAASADALNALLDGRIAEGWDFHHGTVFCLGSYLQWMCRDTYEELSQALVADELSVSCL